MFDFSKFWDVGNSLSNFDGGEYSRSAIGRYYYAVFCCARIYLIYCLNETDFNKFVDIHARVCDRLIGSDDNTESAIGKTLEVLRDLRNLADYNWDDSNQTFFKDEILFAKKESELALMQIEALKKSPPLKI